MPSKTVSTKEITVHYPSKNSPGYSISYTDGGWMPGIFDSVESAFLGGYICLDDEDAFVSGLSHIYHSDKENREITVNDLIDFIK